MFLLYFNVLQITLTSSLHQNLNILRMPVEMVNWGPLKFSPPLRQWEHWEKMCLRWWITIEENKKLIKNSKGKTRCPKGALKGLGICLAILWNSAFCWVYLSLSPLTSTSLHWRRKWQPTPVFLPGESLGQGSLVGCRLWGRTEWDTTKVTSQQQQHFYSFLFVKPPRLTTLPSCIPFSLDGFGHCLPYNVTNLCP